MLRVFLVFILALACAGCASHSANRAWPSDGPPHFLELQADQSISTIHFQRGVYSLGEEDAAGYYYRAPGGLIKHAFAGSQPYDGGIFVSRNGDQVRGYIVWAGGRTRIGNLARARYRFRN